MTNHWPKPCPCPYLTVMRKTMSDNPQGQSQRGNNDNDDGGSPHSTFNTPPPDNLIAARRPASPTSGGQISGGQLSAELLPWKQPSVYLFKGSEETWMKEEQQTQDVICPLPRTHLN